MEIENVELLYNGILILQTPAFLYIVMFFPYNKKYTKFQKNRKVTSGPPNMYTDRK